MDPQLDRIPSTGLDERVQIPGAEPHELAHLEVADPTLQDQAANEGLADAEVGRRAGDVEQEASLLVSHHYSPPALSAGLVAWLTRTDRRTGRRQAGAR